MCDMFKYVDSTYSAISILYRFGALQAPLFVQVYVGLNFKRSAQGAVNDERTGLYGSVVS